MEAEVAALLGAAVGSLATLGAAFVTGRAAARSQFDQWRRQHRRDACLSYLGALHDRDIAMDAIWEALRPSAPDLAQVDERVGRFVGLAREVHRAAEVVLVEGPPVLVKAAGRVGRASGDLSDVMRRMVRDAHAADTARKAADAALAAQREQALHEAVKRFRSVAAEVLDKPR
ncbi:proline dehydrogenase [Streptomyces sp. OR43]|uniref:proline dehydrogenase n=1 Tax=Streptomyces sp. or43 TaxID=2478957 RepID=UPI0011CE2069|nr:proline dehydrogenase [Streptomyces sp. or43]TXS38357.1 proline dehydrogenase [Streptomyces sp. or43]